MPSTIKWFDYAEIGLFSRPISKFLIGNNPLLPDGWDWDIPLLCMEYHTMEQKSKQEEVLLRELAAYKITSEVPDPDFDDFARLAVKITGVQAVIIFFGGENRFIKAVAGDKAFPENKTTFMCSLINQRDIYTEAEDLLRYDQFKFSAVLLENPVVRYIGKEPIFSDNGIILGSICLMDERPRKMSDDQVRQLKILSRLITRHLEVMKTRQ